MSEEKAVPSYLWTPKQRAYVLGLEQRNAKLLTLLVATANALDGLAEHHNDSTYDRVLAKAREAIKEPKA